MQPTKVDSTGATVPDCAVGSPGLAPYLTAIEALYPCVIRQAAWSNATAKTMCQLAAASLAPSYLPIHIAAPLEAEAMPECTAAHMLPGACSNFDPYMSTSYTQRDLCGSGHIRNSCDGGFEMCKKATCPMLGFFPVLASYGD